LDEPKPKNPLGPTGLTVAGRVRALREQRGWTYKQLADRLAAVGRPIPTLGLRKIESADRRVDIDDAVGLAVVFEVNVSTLMLPLTTSGEVQMTAAGTVSAYRAWMWADGVYPLVADTEDLTGAAMAFQLRARPPRRRHRIGIDGLKELVEETPGYTVEQDPDGTVRVLHPGSGEREE
jgi:transcriptional regulator with XRE-family HTH domain